jgi:predicted RNA methylase
MADVKLTPEVADILSQSTIEGNTLKLPPARLDPKLYAQVNKAIVAAGGKWKSGKVSAHVFDGDAREALGMALEHGVVIDAKKARQAFYTPQTVADEVALFAEVGGKRVLEPSAGDGALAKACLKFGASAVDCIEKDESCRKELSTIKGSLLITDFLLVSPTIEFSSYDRIVMNPPFTKGQDLKHVTHAKKWLAPGGKLFAILPDKECPKFAAIGALTVKRFPAGAFKESGTNVATRLIVIERPRS